MPSEPVAVTLLVVEALERLGVPYLIGGSLASAEDIVLAKLEWYQMGGKVSDRQWRDVLGVLKVQEGRLDLAYLRRWARELGVADLFERALAEAEQTGEGR
jgi:hypothetical protein